MSGSHRRSPIGIEIGARAMNAVQLDASCQRVLAAASVARTPTPGGDGKFDAQEAARLESILYRHGFEGTDVVACVPDGKLLTAVLELPPRSSGAPLDQLARVELARVHKKDPAAFEMACWDLPAPARAGDATHLMAAACPHQDANELLDVIESAGLSVRALDIKPWALKRACAPILAAEGTTALLEVGESGAMLAAVRAGVPVYERMMREGGIAVLRGKVQRELGLEPGVAEYLLESLHRPAQESDDSAARETGKRLVREHMDRLKQEVATALDYVAHRYPGSLSLLGLTGPGAGVPGLAACLAQGEEYPVRLLSPSDLVECPEQLACCRDPGLTGALGLALASQRRAA